MNQKTTPTLIGVFVVGAVSLAAVGVVYFGGGQAFVDKRPYVMYFDGSLNGLDVGAPVMFRGVKLGSVTRIVLRYYAAEEKPEIPVFVELLPGVVEHVGGELPPGTVMRSLIQDHGLRARLALESFVTGKLAIQLDFHEDKEARYVGRDPGIPEIPTIPSRMEELENTLKDMPIEEIVAEIRGTFENINKLAGSPDLREAIQSFTATVDEFGALARRIDAQVDPVLTSVKDTFDGANELVRSEQVSEAISSIHGAADDFGRLSRSADAEIKPLVTNFQSTLANADEAFKSIQSVVRKDSPLHYEFTNALKEVAEAAQAVSALAELLERRPEVLLQGKR